MEKLKLDRQSLKKFGKKSAVGFVVLGAIFFLLKKEIYLIFWIVAAAFAILSWIVPKALKYAYVVSMRIAEPIGWLVSRILFTIFFFIIMTPIGLCLKLFGKDLLNIKIDKNCKSYWLKREDKIYDKAHFERQF